MGARYSVMGTKLDILQEICNLAINQVRELYPNLQLMFIPHEDGRFHEVVATSEHELAQHNTGKIAQGILEKNNNRELSSFLGMAIQHEVRWLGLASNDSMLALFNINTDEFNSPKDLRRAVYHLVWHAIDLVEIRQRPEYATKFRSGPMIPKRSPMNMARLNLQADVFSGVMSTLQGEENALDVLAGQRAMDSITPVYARRAEDYPYVIAMEAAKYAYEELSVLKPVRSRYMTYARQMAREVGYAFDDKSIRQWWSFSEPAQDMAWRNMEKETVLGGAIYTSENPFVRATAHLVGDITGVTPLPSAQMGDLYNAFANLEQNGVLHREMMEKTFEDAVARGLLEESGQSLILAANRQNESLADGNILGWCANALQAAGRAFDNAILSGISPSVAARLEFEGTKDVPSWDVLQKIGTTVVEQKRSGLGGTLGNVAEICSNNQAFAPVLNSIRATMKDPNYIRKLEAANDLAMRPAAPSAAPSTPAPSAGPKVSTPAPTPSGLGLGGGSNAAMRHNAMLERVRRERQNTTKGDDDHAK